MAKNNFACLIHLILGKSNLGMKSDLSSSLLERQKEMAYKLDLISRFRLNFTTNGTITIWKLNFPIV